MMRNMKNVSVIFIIVFCLIAFFSQRTFALSFSGTGTDPVNVVSYTGTLYYDDSTGILTVSLTNTTASALGGAITAIGFYNPLGTSITVTGLTGNDDFGIPTNTGNLDFGVTTDPVKSLFGGTVLQGIVPYESSTFYLTLSESGDGLGSLTAGSFLDGGNPIVRFQGVGNDDFSEKVSSSVPVPSTMLLLGTCMLGFVGIEARRRFKRE